MVGYGGFPESWIPNYWFIDLFMAEGTDRTKFDPIITLAPGASITLVWSAVRGFDRIFDWKLIAPDGSTVYYSVRVFFIGDPVNMTEYDEDGNPNSIIIYPDDPRYPF